MRFYITIDTEEDSWGVYDKECNSVENVCKLYQLQELFDEFNATPTYLVNYPVITNDISRDIIKQLHSKGNCEIGMHCHPWNTPPFDDSLDKYETMLCNLPYDLQQNKLKTLHNEISSLIGEEPISFRAGRWGFGPTVAQCIFKLGYKIDTSITPFVEWKEEKGPDFTQAPFHSYRFDPDNVLVEKTDGSMLEVPPTINFIQNNYKLCHKVRSKIISSSLSKYHLLGLLSRLGLLNFYWLSPELASGNQMVNIVKNALKKDRPYVNMSFHSTTLLPGKTPYVRNEQDLTNFLNSIRIVLQFAKDNNLQFNKLREALVF